MAETSSVAVVDIGSNSIKLLVAARRSGGQIEAVKTRTIDARISAGIGQAQPRLSEAGMSAGLNAIRSLLDEAQPLAPARFALVATSAVREAANGAEFRARARAATGHEIRVLSGNEEANLIGAGMTCDPAFEKLRDFYVFDLGGGSLECLAFRNRQIEQRASLPLGCVRLTEKFVSDPAAPFSGAACEAVTQHTRELLRDFPFSLGSAPAVFAGGSMTTARAIFAADEGKEMPKTSAAVSVAKLRALLDRVAKLPLPERKDIRGLPPPRADVFPTALATITALADAGGFREFRHSFYNLRWGVAAEALR